MLNRVTDDQILEACGTSYSASEALKKLGYSNSGSRIKGLKRRLLPLISSNSFTFKSGCVFEEDPKPAEIKAPIELSKTDNCCQFLKSVLFSGPVYVSNILSLGESLGYTDYFIRKSAGQLGVIIEKELERSGKSLWSLPEYEGDRRVPIKNWSTIESIILEDPLLSVTEVAESAILEDPLLSVTEAAKVWGCTYANIAYKARAGKLPYERVRGKTRIRKSDLLKCKDSTRRRSLGQVNKVETDGTLVKSPFSGSGGSKRYSEACRVFVNDCLLKGPILANEVTLLGIKEGFSEKKIRSTCKDLGVIQERRVGEGCASYWKLPDKTGSVDTSSVMPYIEYVSAYRDGLQNEVDNCEKSLAYYKENLNTTQQLLEFLLNFLQKDLDKPKNDD